MSRVEARTSGPSPRVRGGPLLLRDGAWRAGSIPARAGRTIASRAFSRPCGAYPRARGAELPAGVGQRDPNGVSPRARGGAQGQARRTPDNRRIPARAGRSRPASALPSVRGAYPRACGAERGTRKDAWRAQGVSPRARGGVRWEVDSDAVPGRIPARAAMRGRWTWRRRFREAHPRAGGAGRGRPFLDFAADGVSPRGRGNLASRRGERGRQARIPARAGQSPDIKGTVEAEAGSSPRVRGRSRGSACSW